MFKDRREPIAAEDHRGGLATGTNGSGLVPAVEVTRGETVESVHYAAAAVVDHEGNLVAHLGDPGFVTYSRSSLKPFQALAAVRRGFPERFGLSGCHLALVCASHSGEEKHVSTAREILDAIGAHPEDLQCGVHIPLYIDSQEPPIPPKNEFSPLHNNCSGKHSGMLALARILNAPLDQYLSLDSPVQKAIRETVIELLSLDPAQLHIGIDGCSAPNYAVPLRSLAHAYARLAQAGNSRLGQSPAGKEGAKIVGAMLRHPEMVSGTGRLDLALSQATAGAIFTKAGGEAVECAGVPERGWGIAVKVGDGGPRAVGPLLTGVLRELGLLSNGSAASLNGFASPVLRNHRGLVIGTARYVARLVRD